MCEACGDESAVWCRGCGLKEWDASYLSADGLCEYCVDRPIELKDIDECVRLLTRYARAGGDRPALAGWLLAHDPNPPQGRNRRKSEDAFARRLFVWETTGESKDARRIIKWMVERIRGIQPEVRRAFKRALTGEVERQTAMLRKVA